MPNRPDWLYPLWREYGHLVADGMGCVNLAREMGTTEHKARQVVKAVKRTGSPVPPDESFPAEGNTPKAETVELQGDDGSRGYDVAFNEITRTYVISVPKRAEPIILPEAEAKQMIRDYSSQAGRGHTLNEIAVAYGYTHREVHAIKTAMRWTHDHEPFTVEELAERDEEDLIKDHLAQKRRAVALKVQDRHWRDIKKAAENWWALESGTLEPLERAVAEVARTYEPPEVVEVPQETGRRWAMVDALTDLHFGKGGWSGFGAGAYSREECERRLDEATGRIIRAMPGRPERIYTPVGGDLLQIDNANGTTTRGTPQDMDGTPEQILVDGFHLVVRRIDRLLEVAPVTLYFWGGNHDWMLSVALMQFLRAWYRNDPRVTFQGVAEPYQWVRYGSSLLGFHHGDGVSNPGQLAHLMASHAPEHWGQTVHRYMFTGHLHHERVKEVGGVTSILCPSLAGSDRYHARKGYTTAIPALHAYCIDYEHGLFSTLRAAFAGSKRRAA